MTNFLSTVHVMSNKLVLSYSLQNRIASVFEARTCCYVFNTSEEMEDLAWLVSVFSVSLRNTVVAVVIAFTIQELDTTSFSLKSSILFHCLFSIKHPGLTH